MIAKHQEHCVLMPWITINHSLFLDQEFDRLGHPKFAHDLVDMYKARSVTSCTAATVKNFFETYPRALTQLDPTFGSILHRVLKPTYQIETECEVNLFKWLAERCPSSAMLQTDSIGSKPLHHACDSLVRHLGPDSSEICKYLIQKCPESVRESGRADSYPSRLPIRILSDRCDFAWVRVVVVCLLREYPESYDMQAYGRRPSDIPFIQTIKPYLDKEKDIKETAVSLTDSISSFNTAVACTNDQLMRSASTVFGSWATSFINTTEDKLQLISMKLQEMCNEGDYLISL